MRYVLKKARRVTINDTVTKKHKFTIVEIKSASLNNGQETQFAEGVDGSQLAAFDSKKTTQFTFESGVLSTGVIEAQTGGSLVEVTNGTAVKYIEEFTLSGSATTITLAHKARGTTGNEVGWIYKEDSTGEPLTDSSNSFAQGATASATAFSYDATTKVITLPTGKFADGDTVYVEYFPKYTKYTELSNDADKFSVTGEVYVDAYWTDVCTKKDVALQLYCPAGKVSGAFEFTFGDSVATQKVTIDALVDQCRGKTKTLFTLRNYDNEDIDDT